MPENTDIREPHPQDAARLVITAAIRRHFSDSAFRAAVEQAVRTVFVDDRYDAIEYDVRRGALVALHLATGGGAI